MKERSGQKVKLTSYEELLGAAPEKESTEINISLISTFKNHPFKVEDDEKMGDLVKSIMENGIITPVVLRPVPDNKYEMVSGHRRLRAAKLAGMAAIPAVIRELSDEEATILMVDANIQREELLPSEKAFAYRMKMEAMKHQGERTDLTLRQNVAGINAEAISEMTSRQNVAGMNPEVISETASRQNGTRFRTDSKIAKETGDSARQVQRYIRLTELIPELLDLVDKKKIQFVVAVELSYIDKRIQKWVYEYLLSHGSLSIHQIKTLRKTLKEQKAVSEYKVIDILNGSRKNAMAGEKISFPAKSVKQYFPKEYTHDQMEEVIIGLLKEWSGNGGKTNDGE